MNKLKNTLCEGKTVAGPFMKLSNPAVVEILGHAGFDFVIIDTEHGPISIESAENLVRAARLVGLSPIIRIRANDPSLILRALDIGAEGVQVPQISTGNSADAVVKAARYAPEGERGVCRYVRAAAYSHEDKFNYFRASNSENLVIIHIEGSEGVNRLDEILSVEGIDVIFIGPYDLSQSLGIPGEVEHPEVHKKMEAIVHKSRKAGVVVGTFVDDIKAAHRWMKLGVQYISYSVDVGIIYQAAAEIVRKLKQT